MKKCPMCSELIKCEAIKCWHCGRDLVEYTPGRYKKIKSEERDQPLEIAYCKCGAGFLAPKTKIGEKVKCPGCGTIFVMQEPFKILKTDVVKTHIVAHCSCGGSFEYEKSKIGGKAFCPECKTYHLLI